MKLVCDFVLENITECHVYSKNDQKFAVAHLCVLRNVRFAASKNKNQSGFLKMHELFRFCEQVQSAEERHVCFILTPEQHEHSFLLI